MQILKVTNLSKTYGKGSNQIKAVDNVSFTVQSGEFIAITGPSGSGKSTLLHLLGGVDTPSTGQIILDNQNLLALKGDKKTNFVRQNIGFIFQFYNLIPVLTVKENILLPAALAGCKIDSAYLNSLIETLGLKNHLNHLPNELSGGQQQRTAIGRALINNPKIIFADEPTGNLDSRNRRQVINLLKYYNEIHGQTIIMVTHDHDLAQEATRIIHYEDGKIVGDDLN